MVNVAEGRVGHTARGEKGIAATVDDVSIGGGIVAREVGQANGKGDEGGGARSQVHLCQCIRTSMSVPVLCMTCSCT